MSRRSRRSRWDQEAAWRLNQILLAQGFPAVTREEVTALVDSKGGKCEACGVVLIRGNKLNRWSLCLDHDHATGKLRGVLCNRCNRCLGLFKDSAATIRKALCYLS